MNDDRNYQNNIVKDAVKITNTLLKHLEGNCSHCRELFEGIFDNG